MSNYPNGVKPADFDDEKTIECRECGGFGRIEINVDYEPYYKTCVECDGSGEIILGPDYDLQAKEEREG